MKPKYINLTTYDDFERLDTFVGNMEEYRKSKLESAAGHVYFIKKLFPRKKIMVVELGSGNSKTLFALEKAGLLKKGYGLEISKSRHKFAQLWKKENGFGLVENLNEDVLKTDFSKFGSFDLCFCVDLAFQFFEPIQKSSALRILKQIHKQLTPGGKIILELDGVARIISRMRNNEVKLWEEFSPPDPWRFSLWDCKFYPSKGFIDWRKIFIKRNEFGIFENKAVLKVYKKNDLRKLLNVAGFSKVAFYANWKAAKFKDDKGEYIAVGTK